MRMEINVYNLSFERPPTGSWCSILQMSSAPLEGLDMHMAKSIQLGESRRFEARARGEPEMCLHTSQIKYSQQPSGGQRSTSSHQII